MSILNIAVVGAGTMGNGIAQVFAMHGFDVKLADVNEPALHKGLAAIRNSLSRMAKKGSIAEADIAGILARIHPTTLLAELADRDLVSKPPPKTRRSRSPSSANWAAWCGRMPFWRPTPRPSRSPALPPGCRSRNGWWACTS